MPEPEYDIEALEAYGSSDPPVIDALIKSWLDQLDYVYSLIQTTGLRYKLGSAEGSDLDDIWGRIFQIKRYTQESDDDYRARLIVHTQILMGAGTTPNCEAIIDSLLGTTGATEISSRWPGIVHVEFRDVSCIKLAKAAESKINKILPLAIAAGMTYEMLLPIVDYTIHLMIKATGSNEYDLSALYQKWTETDYDIGAKIVVPRESTYTINTYVQRFHERSYVLRRGLMKFDFYVEYALGLLMERVGVYSYSMESRITKDGSKSYFIDCRMKSDRVVPYNLVGYLQRERHSFYGLSAIVEVET